MRNLLLQAIRKPILLCSLLAAVPVLSQGPVDPIVHRLSRIEISAIGGVGYAGITSEGEKDYRAILHEPGGQALKAFNELYETGNLQAKAYALLGIKKLDPATFAVLYGSLPETKAEVITEQGCIVIGREFRDIAKEIDVGKFPYNK